MNNVGKKKKKKKKKGKEISNATDVMSQAHVTYYVASSIRRRILITGWQRIVLKFRRNNEIQVNFIKHISNALMQVFAFNKNHTQYRQQNWR